MAVIASQRKSHVRRSSAPFLQTPCRRPHIRRAFVTSSLLMHRSDLRPGEVAVVLPDTFDAQLYFIGRIRTPWMRREDCPKNARESPSVCTLEVDERWGPALADVET